MMNLFLDNAVQALPQLHAAYDPDPADLYLYDIGAYAGRALAEAQGRPVVQLSPKFVAWKGYEQEVAAPLWQCRAPTPTARSSHGGLPIAMRRPPTWTRSPACPTVPWR
ncbi:hypothetical protein [Nocardia sp. CS682]|uniref:hypothetical protein n=1 Tax=Nocardia sp. CS682 TaxID=1047172 RepID=UPI00197EC647|nr:hypothetical protein [Nocardia sp. CS682]